MRAGEWNCIETALFKPGISVLRPKGPYPPKNWEHMKKSGDNTINDQNFIENVPVGFRREYFTPCNLFLYYLSRWTIQVNTRLSIRNGATDDHKKSTDKEGGQGACQFFFFFFFFFFSISKLSI